MATIATGMFPVGSAVNQIRSLVYITNFDSRTVSVISVGTNSVVATVQLAAKPFGIAVNPAGTRAYVGLNDGTVSVIDTLTNSIIANFLVGTTSLSGIAVDSSGRFAYLADFSAQMIRVIDFINLNVVADIALAGRPFAVAIHPNGTVRLRYDARQQRRRACTVGHRYGNQYACRDYRYRTHSTWRSGQPGWHLGLCGNHQLCCKHLSVIAISTETNTIVGSVTTAPGSFTVGFHPDGSRRM